LWESIKDCIKIEYKRKKVERTTERCGMKEESDEERWREKESAEG
jgi:hypothetical protein